jgi:hypothetical protein
VSALSSVILTNTYLHMVILTQCTIGYPHAMTYRHIDTQTEASTSATQAIQAPRARHTQQLAHGAAAAQQLLLLEQLEAAHAPLLAE